MAVDPDDRDIHLQQRGDIGCVVGPNVYPAFLAANPARTLFEVHRVGLVAAHLLRGYDEVQFGAQVPAGDPQQVLDRMPVLALNELNPGDALIISGGKGADPGNLTAITLVAGVEPLLRVAPPRQVGGAWNFGDIGLPQE